MTEITVPTFSSNSGSDIQANYVSELWKKIEKNELRNEKAERKVDLLFSEYNNVLAPYDKKLGNARCAWVKHLLSFLTAKELKKDTQNRLMQVIEHELSDFYQLPFFYDMDEVHSLSTEYDAYHDKVFRKEKQKALDAACSEFENAMKDMFGEDIDLPHTKIRETLASGNRFDLESLMDSISASFFEHHAEATSEWEQSEDEWHDFEFDYFDSEEDDALNIKEMFRGTQLNKMYKRIASVIHPDKETDPLKKEEKHRLMQTLAAAKRDNDVMTLVRMFTKYVPDAECFLDETTLLRMEHLLEMRIRELNRLHRDIFNNQGFKSIVWKEFSATSKKKTQAKMQEHITMVENSITTLQKRIRKLDSLKQLNKYLKSLSLRSSYL
ncbi:hypothetical protein MD535_24175 [Vibrio sp. ZSDZ65]|uniref:J domain-containing protein n=1 Tax=Vibrio qingdaonensis TaxID=2829491 RepID=A0A9X3CSX9_9VIBR|nr:hypothetical protein [Vibrio qingdaonensis]MCW8349092.1 hypothetical protein [Vibrio qingdaonensis]